jgi:hypothetical protein
MRFLLILLIAGAVIGYHGFNEFRLARAASATPKTITCADLEQSGPGENVNIRLTDMLLCSHSVIYKSRKTGGEWQTIWLPAVALDGPYVERVREMLINRVEHIPPPTNVRVIVKTGKVRNEHELEQLLDEDELEGMVVNSVESLGSEERKLLAEGYPGIDFSKCWIVEVGRQPKSVPAAMGIMGGGGALMLLGLGIFARGFMKSDDVPSHESPPHDAPQQHEPAEADYPAEEALDDEHLTDEPVDDEDEPQPR